MILYDGLQMSWFMVVHLLLPTSGVHHTKHCSCCSAALHILFAFVSLAGVLGFASRMDKANRCLLPFTQSLAHFYVRGM